jgi:hypothetical protein
VNTSTKNTNYFTSSQIKKFLIEATMQYTFLRFYAARFQCDKWIVGVFTKRSQCVTIIHNPHEWQRWISVCQGVTRQRENKNSLFRDLPVEVLVPALTGEAPAEQVVPWWKNGEAIVEKLMIFTATACITVGLPALLNAPWPADLAGVVAALLVTLRGPEIYRAFSDQIDPAAKRVLLKIGIALGELTFGVIGAGCIVCTFIFFILIYLYPAEMWHLLKLVKK